MEGAFAVNAVGGDLHGQLAVEDGGGAGDELGAVQSGAGGDEGGGFHHEVVVGGGVAAEVARHVFGHIRGAGEQAGGCLPGGSFGGGDGEGEEAGGVDPLHHSDGHFHRGGPGDAVEEGVVGDPVVEQEIEARKQLCGGGLRGGGIGAYGGGGGGEGGGGEAGELA